MKKIKINHQLKRFFISVAIFLLTYSFVSAQGTADLELKTSNTNLKIGDEFLVDIVLKNPNQNNIISVRSWLDFDSSVLEAVSIDSSKSKFTLVAPGEDFVSNTDEKVKIGRSNISGGVKDLETTVATVKFKVISNSKLNSSIDFYDYQVSELGHTSVNIIDQNFPLNILSNKPKSLILNINSSGSSQNDALVNNPPVNEVDTSQETNYGGNINNTNTYILSPVSNLKINTGLNYVDLLWDKSNDINTKGYNIYYGRQSASYTRLKTIGNTNKYRLDNLENNQTYYFAVKAYDQFNKESAYSNEVGIIVGQPLSSTSPFPNLIDREITNIPEQPQNGPMMLWALLSAIGLAGSIVFSKKKQIN